MSLNTRNCLLSVTAIAAGSLFQSCSTSPSGNEPWRAENDKTMKEYKVVARKRNIPRVNAPLKLEEGKPLERNQLPQITIADGVTAKVAWSHGALLEFVEMEKGATYPEETLGEELITVVRGGSATCTMGDRQVELGKDAVLYLTPGMKRSLRAGPNGWQAIEVYSPVRVAHLNLAGAGLGASADVSFADQAVLPSVEAGKVYNLNEVQWTAITDQDPSKSHPRSAANSRLIWGRNVQLSFVRMDPNSAFPMHAHPEEQLLATLDRQLTQGVMTKTYQFSGETGNVLLLPGGMAHSAKVSEFGADQLDVFWPVRPDYVEKARKQQALFSEVVAPGTEPVKLAGGLTFAEGPTWLKGKLYLSDMFFKDPLHGDWTGSPARSRFIVMEPDGKWKVLFSGMQTNGSIASADGNLIICDMFGNRVVSVDPKTGKVLKTILDKVDGKSIDGPNDLVMDAKGGIYVTDPQFTPEAKKNQPGKQVYYIGADGTAKVVIPAGEYAMPNGVEISPDGRTLYVDNTWLQPGENFLWAYDVQPDGSLKNKRKFAEFNLTPEVLSAGDPVNRFDSRADGSAVDLDGRIYVATLSGVQVFNKSGAYVGTIWCPEPPVSCTFGGKNGDVLYMVGNSSIWSIQTKVQGFRLPNGLN